MASTTKGNIKNRLRRTHARDMDDMADSMVTLTDAQTLSGFNTFTGGISSNYLDFATGNCNNLTGTVVAITDAEADAGVGGNAAAILAATMNASALNTSAHDTGAAGAIYLPVCAADTHTALHIIGDMDEANTFTIFARGAVGAGTDVVFSKQTIAANGKGGIGVITSGTPATPTAIKLIYTPAAANTNVMGIGTIMHFYAPIANRWLVKIDAIAEGTGATGTFTTATS
jgi:hypothetical protein|tara:strand:- start:1731 stop:2417 length:687 start_codon:yes stop_codon:yes gene_type:complete